MRFKLKLTPIKPRQRVMWNYHYPLSAWLYSVFAKADEKYSKFLHDKGYQTQSGGKNFKHFTFSDLRCKIGKTTDSRYFEITSQSIEWIVSFYIEKTAESFIGGLFQDQTVHLYDENIDARFFIERVEILPDSELTSLTKFKATSAMVIAEKQLGIDQYIEPTDERFGKYLINGLIDKYLSVQLERGAAIDPAIHNTEISFNLTKSSQIKSRKITIKEGKTSATEIKGYRDFEFELTAPHAVTAVGLLGGFGKNCAEGFGFCEVV